MERLGLQLGRSWSPWSWVQTVFRVQPQKLVSSSQSLHFPSVKRRAPSACWPSRLTIRKAMLGGPGLTVTPTRSTAPPAPSLCFSVSSRGCLPRVISPRLPRALDLSFPELKPNKETNKNKTLLWVCFCFFFSNDLTSSDSRIGLLPLTLLITARKNSETRYYENSKLKVTIRAIWVFLHSLKIK